MIETTARHALPLLAAGQAQKELVHNEALAQLDLLVSPAVEAIQNAPPVTAAAGQCWIVDDAPTGAWAGHPGAVACWSASGWRFAAPTEGMRAWVSGQALWAERVSGAWRTGIAVAAELRVGGQKVVGERRPAIVDPAGGVAPDAEARSAIAAILSALRSHGLISI